MGEGEEEEAEDISPKIEWDEPDDYPDNMNSGSRNPNDMEGDHDDDEGQLEIEEEDIVEILR